MAICWERLSRQLFTVLILNAVLVVLVPLPFGVWGGMWNSIVLAPYLVFCLLFTVSPSSGPSPQLLKSGPAMGLRKCSLSAEGTRRGEYETGVFSSRKWGSGFRFRKAVDAFLLHLECNFGL